MESIEILGANVPSYHFKGCLTEGLPTGTRALQLGPYTVSNPPGMTYETCQQYCYSNNYVLAGVEYGRECCKFCCPIHIETWSDLYWIMNTGCGNEWANGGGLQSTSCNMACEGNSSKPRFLVCEKTVILHVIHRKVSFVAVHGCLLPSNTLDQQ